jgi:putative tryptophan/tyrosine transport system substrate-binding protein
MRRRDVIALLGGAAAWPLIVRAQPSTKKAPRIGIIDYTSMWDPFRQELRELGYVEGETIHFEHRTAEGAPERLAQAASELARLPVNVIATFGTPAAHAAKQATTTVPIVMVSIGDPIRAGLVTSLGRPGANITGNTIISPDLIAKRLQLLKETMPSTSRIAFLWNPDNASNAAIFEEMRRAAPSFDMDVLSVEARGFDDLDRAMAHISAKRPDAFLMTNDPLHQRHIGFILDLLAQNRLPSMFQRRENVLDGGLMSYGASLPDQFRRGAVYVHKILQGANPADLPIEQPVKFELVVNLKTAKALALDIPLSVLARADEVIE